ncbi:hypothetical protein CDL15_Pgr014526 [Punica granatum]|uniref:Uncharacterized protein n=1 Tax=Punica granatum TaxID=22663 RepID=A0A218WE87_PUNGR|nr:hypothetical protein CDL15_Pgr014526 [Punica granatum]
MKSSAPKWHLGPGTFGMADTNCTLKRRKVEPLVTLKRIRSAVSEFLQVSKKISKVEEEAMKELREKVPEKWRTPRSRR